MVTRGGEELFEISDARKHRRNCLKAKANRVCEQPCNRRLARARRPPQDDRGELARRHHPPNRAVIARQMILPDDIAERLRTQPFGERRVCGRGQGRGLIGEQVGHCGSIARAARGVTLSCKTPSVRP